MFSSALYKTSVWTTKRSGLSSSIQFSRPASILAGRLPLVASPRRESYHHCYGHKNVVIVRFAHHPSKMGLHLQNLDEMAHDKRRQQAQERRQKKKEKEAARKSKHKSGSKSPTANAKKSTADDDDDDDAEPNIDQQSDEDSESDSESDESVLPDPVKLKERMLKVVDSFTNSLRGIRGAEPTPELFDDVIVEAYGSRTPLKSVAQVIIMTPTLATANCFDPALAKAVYDALLQKLGFNATIEEGGLLSIPIPRVSMETRQNTATALKKRTETYRQRVRGVRRNALEIVKKGVAGKLEGVSKDDAFRVQKEIDAITDQVIQKLNEAADKKHDSIMNF